MDIAVTVQFIEGCPNWSVAVARVQAAADRSGMSVSVRSEMVATHEDAVRLGFTGSPTILVGGKDPFADGSQPASLACRLYPSSEGWDGAPSVADLEEALAAAEGAEDLGSPGPDVDRS